jgi:tryptophan-rich sensory protein
MLNGIVEAGREFAGASAELRRPSHTRQVVWLVGLMAVCFGAAGIGGAVGSSSVGSWYASLAKPSWTPPDWLFGPVWTTLYFLMAVSAWLVWRRAGWPAARTSLCLFGLQLGLNTSWSVLFFGFRNPGLAMAGILALWLAIAATVVNFWGRSTVAAVLLTPYLAWTTFAAVLNFGIWRMNA